MGKKIMANLIVKTTVGVALAIALGTLTAQYVSMFLTPNLAYWLLYFIMSMKIINAYEKQRNKDQGAEEAANDRAGKSAGNSEIS